MTFEPVLGAAGWNLSIDANDFDLFQLAVQFVQDRDVIDGRWKDLQRQVHPDRFAAQGAAAQRVAMQWAIRVNEAYRRLKDPLARATYLCELHGHPIQAGTNTAMPTPFLMQQMDWREALEVARTADEVQRLVVDVASCQGALLRDLAALIDDRLDWPAAAAQVRSLMFVTRFAEDVERRLEASIPA